MSLLIKPALTRSQIAEAINSEARGPRLAFIFDDGYQSNYSRAFPIFKKYGFAATIALEIDKIGLDYNGDPNYPVLDANELRTLIDSGWEICNHPQLELAFTESQMVAMAQAENALLKSTLEAGGNTRFANFEVTSAVYRGGSRSDTSDKAYRFVFDKVRSINGAIAVSGDHQYVFKPGGEQTMQMSAFPVDEPSSNIESSLNFIAGLAQTGNSAIVYAHDVAAGAGPGGAIPWISENAIERILRLCYEKGISVVPLNKLHQGNAVRDSVFAFSSGTFGVADPADSSAFSVLDTLNGAARCVLLTAAAFRSNTNTRYVTDAFIAEPLCRYRIRVRYKIDADLTLLGGTGNRNHGLDIALSSVHANTAAESAGENSMMMEILNDPAATARIPYLATAGYAEQEITLVNGSGERGQIRCSLFNCTGTVRIGQITVEKLESIVTRPWSGNYAGAGTFNTTAGRNVYLPSLGGGAQRAARAVLRAYAAPLEPSVTYDFSINDSAHAALAAPVLNQTNYIHGVGLGAFAGQNGRLATWNGSAWTFATIGSGTFLKANLSEGIANRYWMHYGYPDTAAQLPRNQEYFAPFIPHGASQVKDVGSGLWQVYNATGTRSDAFAWWAEIVEE